MTIIYDELKSKFIRDIDSIESNIEDTLEDRIYERMKRVTSTAEKRARKNSLIEMYKIIKIDEIPDDSRVSIEYNIPC
jgi:geranylgeranyl pyrophosphate synthase